MVKMELDDFENVVARVKKIQMDSIIAQLAIGACIVSLDNRSPYTVVRVGVHEMPYWQQKILEAWVMAGITQAIVEEGVR